MRLEELCVIQSGGTPRRGNASYYGGGIPWAKISDLNAYDGLVRVTEESITPEGLASIGGRLVPAGTVLLDAGDNRVTARPVVTDGDLNLEVLEVTGPLPKDGVQSALDGLTKKLNDNYPLGIHADSVDVTDTGVVGKFSSHNASIPNEDANPCFARL